MLMEVVKGYLNKYSCPILVLWTCDIKKSLSSLKPIKKGVITIKTCVGVCVYLLMVVNGDSRLEILELQMNIFQTLILKIKKKKE